MPYLIDGHNLIPKIQGFSLRELDDETRLIGLLQVFCRMERQKVEVFFDGAPAGHTGQRKAGTVVVHAVPAGLKADDAIADRLRKLGTAAQNWRVVTSDRQVQAEARSHRATVVPSETFAGQLLAAQQKASQAARESGETPPDDMEEWLRIFGG